MRPLLICILASIMMLILMPLSSTAQEIDVLELLDSFYWERNFEEIISIAETELENEKDLYYQVGMNYYRGNANYKLGNFKDALKITEDNYEVSKGLNPLDTLSVELAIDACQKLGDYCFQAEKYAVGIEALERGIELQSKYLTNNNWRPSLLYHKLGALLRIASNYDEAREKLQYGLDTYVGILPDFKKERILPVYQAEIAQVHNDTNNPLKAISIYKKMIKTAEKNENIARISIYNNNCGLAYDRLGDYSKAKYHYQKNLEANLEWQGPKTTRMITSYTNLSSINTKLNNDKKALEYFQKAIDLIIEVLGEDNIRLGDQYFTLGSFHLKNNELKKALDAFQKDIQIREKHVSDEDLNLNNARQSKGKTLLIMGQVDEAISTLQKAAKYRSLSNLEQDVDQAYTYALLYDAFIQKGDIDKAKESLNKSMKAQKYDLDDPLAFEKTGVPIGLIEPLVRMIDFYSRSINQSPNDLVKGEEIIEISYELIQYLKYNLDEVSSRQILAENTKPLNDAIVKFYYKVYQAYGNPEHIEKAFATIENSNNTFLYENLAEEGKNSYKLPKAISDKRKEILTSISKNQEKIKNASSDDQNYNSLLAELNQSKEYLYLLIEKIKSDHLEYYNTIYNYPITDIKTTQEQLSPDEIFVSYYFGSEDLYAITIDKHNVKYTKLANAASIKTLIQNLINHLKKKESIEDIESLSNELHTSLIAPLGLDNYERALISGDNILGLLPFEILKKNGTPYNSNKTIAYQYSATLMNAPKNLGKSGFGVLAMAPVFENQNSDVESPILFTEAIRGVRNSHLPETENEVNAVANLFSGTALLRSDANIHQFEELSYGKSILHLATHGFADQVNSNKSCLYFAQSDSTEESGQLFAEEIAQMNIKADLVTLSACNTGTGKIQKGEGIASLGRAFAYAGCPNQVISLWAVNDKTTTELMTYFYTNLKEGQTKATALKNAKSQYLDAAPEILKHPYYWAGFVYYGSDTELNQQSHFGNLGIISGVGLGLFLLGYFFKYKSSANSKSL